MATSKKEKMQNWAKQNKLDNSIIESLINKYGEDEAYRLMRDALLRPYELAPTLEGYDNKKISSLSLLQHLTKEDTPAQRSPSENQVSATEVNTENTNTTTNSRIDREHIKYAMKNDALTARIILKNGQFTSQIKQEIIDELTPIYGAEVSEKIYTAALNQPTNLYVALDKKPNAQTSKAILQHILTLEDPKDIEDVINATKSTNFVSSDRFTRRPSNTNTNTNTPTQRPKDNSTSNGYTVGNYTSIMPRGLAVGCENLILRRENNTARHYLCANGYLTNIGVTHRYYSTQFESTFGKETTNLLLKAEKAARSKSTVYSTDGGRTWQPMPAQGGSKYLLGGLQRKIKGGESCLIKSKNGDVIELKRITDGGFEIVKVNDTKITHPSDMTKSLELNMRVLDANYLTIKSTCNTNWNRFSIDEQAKLVYSHFHQPTNTRLAYTNRTSNAFILPTQHRVDMA